MTFINVNPTGSWNQGSASYTNIRPNLRLHLSSVTHTDNNTGKHELYGELYLFATAYVDTAASMNYPCSWTTSIWYSADGVSWGGAANSATNNFTQGVYNGWGNSELHGIQGVWSTFNWGSEPTVYVRIWCQSSVHNWEPGYWQQTAYAQRQMPTVVWVHDGSAWRPHYPLIHNGTEWKEALAYSHDGSKWCMSHA